MKKLKLFLIACLLPLLGNSCSYSSSSGWSFSDSDDYEERRREEAIDRKTDRILKVGKIKDPARARREAKIEVFEEEVLRPVRP